MKNLELLSIMQIFVDIETIINYANFVDIKILCQSSVLQSLGRLSMKVDRVSGVESGNQSWVEGRMGAMKSGREHICIDLSFLFR